MAKYAHLEDTRIALDDLENRVQQLMEANEAYLGVGHNDTLIRYQNDALASVLVLIKQVINTGHVQRGTPVVPDDIEKTVKTKWNKRPQLGLSKLMLESNRS